MSDGEHEEVLQRWQDRRIVGAEAAQFLRMPLKEVVQLMRERELYVHYDDDSEQKQHGRW